MSEGVGRERARLTKKAVTRRMPSVINHVIEDMLQQQLIVAERFSDGGSHSRTFQENISYEPVVPITNLTLPDKITCIVSLENNSENEQVNYSQQLAFLKSMKFLSSIGAVRPYVLMSDTRSDENGTFAAGEYQVEFSPDSGVNFYFLCRLLFNIRTEEINLSYLRLNYSVKYSNRDKPAFLNLNLYGGKPYVNPISLIGAEQKTPSRPKFEPVNLFPEEEVSPPADNVSWAAFLEKRGMSLENLPRDIFSTGDVKAKKLLEMGKNENVTVADLENPDDALKRKIMAILGKLPEEK
tara:strand:- start:1064 stop:1951 length:888 start_codon:yes stop_codon:yes gene_type:complete